MPDSDPPIVTLERASRAHESVLDNLFQLYTHDFSEQWAGMARGELDAHGRFPPYPHLASYWQDETRVPLLVRAGGHLAGFALLNRHSHAGRTVDWSIAEFFIVRKHRRSGVGRVAVSAIFERYPGVWETAVARKNGAALAFWRKVIGSDPRVADLEELDVNTAEWNGPVLCYRVRDA
jgi:predicted acetyltransferase